MKKLFFFVLCLGMFSCTEATFTNPTYDHVELRTNHDLTFTIVLANGTVLSRSGHSCVMSPQGTTQVTLVIDDAETIQCSSVIVEHADTGMRLRTMDKGNTTVVHPLSFVSVTAQSSQLFWSPSSQSVGTSSSQLIIEEIEGF